MASGGIFRKSLFTFPGLCDIMYLVEIGLCSIFFMVLPPFFSSGNGRYLTIYYLRQPSQDEEAFYESAAFSRTGPGR